MDLYIHKSLNNNYKYLQYYSDVIHRRAERDTRRVCIDILKYGKILCA
ncbi:MAG: hypothetical protein Hyperionvirus1_184 [Hyperionvirus sp.]|uniref:Uncharacterized protein n=1 Tax=Hyperionvirus sp. TaxID=2487770 RepID=A0A3G5A5T1_9VIRU|nr:MAG: hypothetical protein Hyperionvirus1_184 [Hyperionvirus sp.]